MYVPRSSLTSTVAGRRRLEATRRLLGSGSDEVGAGVSLGIKEGSGDKEDSNEFDNWAGSVNFKLLLSTQLCSTIAPLPPTFHP